MSQAYELIKGLRNTQASVVHVPFEVVADLIGYEVAEHLAQKVTSFAQTPFKPNMPSKEAMEKAEMRKPYSLGTFDRADLLSVIDELAAEKGGMDNLIESYQDNRSVLQKVREDLGTTIPFPQRNNDDDDGDTLI